VIYIFLGNILFIFYEYVSWSTYGSESDPESF
jgi:hypothetical protein